MRAVLFAQGCIVLEDGRMVDEGGHLLMGAIRGWAVGSRSGAVGGRGRAVGSRGRLVVVNRFWLGMVDAGLWFVNMWRGCHVVNRGVVNWCMAVAGGGVGVSLLPWVKRDLGDGDGVTWDQGVARIMLV